MTIDAITLDENGGETAGLLRKRFPEFRELRSGRDGLLQELFRRSFSERDGIVCVMAAGIVVRMIAPLAQSKLTDPAVVVVDDARRWAISLLSGHEGGANDLAYQVAATLGAEPVITTGSDTKRRVLVGVGCRRGTKADAIREAVAEALGEAGFGPEQVRRGASIRLKADEAGLVQAFRDLNIPLLFIDEGRINSFDGPFARSEAAERAVGVKAVAEPCALLAGRNAKLILPKRIRSGVTVAVALEE